jgi:hypothetical protein
MQKYISAVRENICKICVDSTTDGDCTLSKNEFCAVEMYLPQIVEVVHKTNSEYVEDHYKTLKETICAECKTRDSYGNCFLKDDANCSLDRYFPIIVETIQKVDAKTL